MFDFLSSIFKYSYWTAIIIVLFVLGLIVKTCESKGEEWNADDVTASLEMDNTEDAVQKMHEHFIEQYRADTFRVGKKEGVLVEKVARKCIEMDDRESAELLYEEYRRAMSDHGRKKIEEYLNGE